MITTNSIYSKKIQINRKIIKIIYVLFLISALSILNININIKNAIQNPLFKLIERNLMTIILSIKIISNVID